MRDVRQEYVNYVRFGTWLYANPLVTMTIEHVLAFVVR